MRRELTAGVLAAAAFGCTGEDERARRAGEVFELVAPVHAVSGDNFQAHLQGGHEVPPNNSQAQGQAIFRLSRDGTELHYKLIVANIQNVTQAHIHLGAAGTAPPGNVVAWLYPTAPPSQLIPGRSQGVLQEGTLTGANVVGLLGGGGLEALLEAIRAGNTYVNVHTSQFPPGEIRGQIR